MGVVPPITNTMNIGLEAGPAGMVCGWFCAAFFILLIGTSMTFLGSFIPTSGGLYYWTNYYALDSLRVPPSFLIGCANSLGLFSGSCGIANGVSSQLLSAVYVAKDGYFEITDKKLNGVFAAYIVLDVIIVCCLSSTNTRVLQAISIVINCFLIVLFLIAVPVGVRSKDFEYNSAKWIFTNFENARNWSTGWSFMLSWKP
jgi:amino acid transporter